MQREKDIINNKAVTLNLTQGLPRLTWLLSLRNSMRGRSRTRAGMTSLFDNGNNEIPHQVRDDRPLLNNNYGFTLIELLVVVLIIGILAAVALPQYQVAVAKSRMSQLLALADAVRKAEEVYYLANGRYTQNWEELDVGIPGTVQGAVLQPGNGVTLKLRVAPFGVTAADSHLPSYLIVGFYNQNEGDTFNGGRRACYAPTTDTLGTILCQNISHRKSGDTVSADGSSKRYFF